MKARYFCHCSTVRMRTGAKGGNGLQHLVKVVDTLWYSDCTTLSFANHAQISSLNTLHRLHIIKLQTDVGCVRLSPEQIIMSDFQIIMSPNT